MPIDIDLVGLTESHQEVAGDPHVIGALLGALGEHLEFPLALGNLSVDTLMVDASLQTKFQMLLHDLASHITDVGITDASVVFPLRIRVTLFRPA